MFPILWEVGHLSRYSGLTWMHLEKLLIDEYAEKGMTIEAMKSLSRLAQAREETSRELGARVA